jgi:hypothetical protein
MKDVMRGPRGFVVPSVDRFGVSEAVRVSSSGSGSRPCTLPPDICCLPAFLPRQLPTAISAAPSYGWDLRYR